MHQKKPKTAKNPVQNATKLVPNATNGPTGSPSHVEFEAKAKAWYYAELLRDERKRQGRLSYPLYASKAETSHYPPLLVIE